MWVFILLLFGSDLLCRVVGRQIDASCNRIHQEICCRMTTMGRVDLSFSFSLLISFGLSIGVGELVVGWRSLPTPIRPTNHPLPSLPHHMKSQLIIFIRDLSFGILFIRKLHQIHFVFLLIILGYQSLFYTSLNSSSLLLISTAGKDFTSHRIIFLSFFISFPVFSLVFIFGSEIY